MVRLCRVNCILFVASTVLSVISVHMCFTVLIRMATLLVALFECNSHFYNAINSLYALLVYMFANRWTILRSVIMISGIRESHPQPSHYN
jgi:hypothetical protein